MCIGRLQIYALKKIRLPSGSLERKMQFKIVFPRIIGYLEAIKFDMSKILILVPVLYILGMFIKSASS